MGGHTQARSTGTRTHIRRTFDNLDQFRAILAILAWPHLRVHTGANAQTS